MMRRAAAAALVFVVTGANAGAQSLLERSPNVSGDWSGASGTVYFHFIHRFTTSDAPERKVSNVPTFLVAAGLPKRLLAGFHYSTNSTLAPRFPNEWELFARWLPLSEDYSAPLDLGAQVGYNNAAAGVDAELSAARRLGIARVLVAGRALSDPFEEGNPRFAVAGGATLRLNQYFALAGDVASFLNRDSAERVAWSAGIHFAIPLSPHTVSIHATNAMLTTLQGASRGADEVRWGFEFTIPLTLRRYFGRRAVDTSITASATGVEDQAAVPADSTRAIVPPPAPAAVPPSAVPPPAAAPSAAPSRAADTTRSDSARAQPARTTTARATTPPAAPSRTTAPATRPPAPRPAASQPAARVIRTSIKNVSYLQPRLQVTVGTTVEWTNNDPMPHTVTATDKSFNSGLINPGKTWRYTFTKAGTFEFFCIPHPFMKGTIVVRNP